MLDFEWDASNLSHIAEHGLTRAEVEEILDSPETEFSAPYTYNEEWRVSATGPRSDGRIVEVIFTQRAGITRVVTAYPVPRRIERQFRERHQ